MSKIPLLVIVGPTASGKSAFAVEIARAIGGEIISADSRQVYRKLDIGTGKITKREMKYIPHHLLDVASPSRTFTAFQFREQAIRAIKAIHTRGNVPIICGGTGFYIDALLRPDSISFVPRNLALRKSLQSLSAEKLFTMLKKLDPKRARAMNTPSERNNPVRLTRAIEIAKSKSLTLGTPLPHIRELWIGLDWPSDMLKERINARLAARFKMGMVREAQRLRKSGLSLKRMRSLGLEYGHLADFLEKKTTRAELEETLRHKIWQYAKRQRTYWQKNSAITWIVPSKKTLAQSIQKAKLFLNV